MKLSNWILIAVAATTLAVSSAHADESQVLVSTLTQGSLSTDHSPYLYGGGTVTINLSTQTIRLEVTTIKNCPPEMFCTMEMPTPLIVELPIVNRLESYCKSVTYIARQDLRPVDGALSEIQVTYDEKESSCFVPGVPGTNVLYRTAIVNRIGGREVIATSRFKGTDLVPGVL